MMKMRPSDACHLEFAIGLMATLCVCSFGLHIPTYFKERPHSFQRCMKSISMSTVNSNFKASARCHTG